MLTPWILNVIGEGSLSRAIGCEEFHLKNGGLGELTDFHEVSPLKGSGRVLDGDRMVPTFGSEKNPIAFARVGEV